MFLLVTLMAAIVSNPHYVIATLTLKKFVKPTSRSKRAPKSVISPGCDAGGWDHRGRQLVRALGHHPILRVPRWRSAVPHHQPHQGPDTSLPPEVSQREHPVPSLTLSPCPSSSTAGCPTLSRHTAKGRPTNWTRKKKLQFTNLIGARRSLIHIAAVFFLLFAPLPATDLNS